MNTKTTLVHRSLLALLTMAFTLNIAYADETDGAAAPAKATAIVLAKADPKSSVTDKAVDESGKSDTAVAEAINSLNSANKADLEIRLSSSKSELLIAAR